MAEEYKRKLYADHGMVVIPFAVESTGRIGGAARAFLLQRCPDKDKKELKYFYRDLSIVLALHLGKMMYSTRSRAA